MGAAFGGEGDVNVTISAQNDTTGAIDSVIENLSRLRQAGLSAGEALEQMGNGLGGGFGGGGMGGITGMMRNFGTAVDDVVTGMGHWIATSTAMLASMAAWSVFNDAAQAVRNFGEEIFNLSKYTEQNIYGWRYTYASPGMGPQAAMGQALDIAKWTSGFSMDIPFTQQDLMASVSGASRLGLNPQGLEHYYPIFADIAAAKPNPLTGQPITLGEVVRAVTGEEMGYKRMMQYTVGIAPEDLVPYGLAYEGHGIGGHITDMTTLLPALQKYSEGRGYTQWQGGKDVGAAYTAAHHTFWGEQSSFIDRINRMQLMLGGMDINTFEEKPGGLFAQLKADLEGVSEWMDTHWTQLQKLADIGSKFLGGAVQGGTSVFEGMFKGLESSPFAQQVLDDITNAGKWLADPANQKKLEQLGETIGTNIGSAADKAYTSIMTLKQGVDDLAGAFGGKAATFQGLTDFFTFFPAQIGRDMTALSDFVNMLRDIRDGNWDKAGKDYVQFLQDEANAATFGAANAAIAATNPPAHGVAAAIAGAPGGTVGGATKPAGSGATGQYISSLGGGPGGGIGYVSGSQAMGAWIVGELARGMQSGMVNARSTASSIGQSIADEIRRAFASGQHTGIGDAVAAMVKREIDGAAGYGSVTAGGSWAALGTLGGLGR